MRGADLKVKLSIVLLLTGLAESVLFPIVHASIKLLRPDPETADIGVFLLLLAITGSLLIFVAIGQANIARRARVGVQFWHAPLLFVILLFSVATVTPLAGSEAFLWFGYGYKIAIISAFSVPLVLALFYTERPLKADIGLAIAVVGGASALYLPSILQPPWGVINWKHSVYVVNELMAPQSGSYPIVNFSAQYTSLLGYVFNALFQSHGTVDDAVWFLTSLAILTIVLSLLPVARVFPPNRRYLAVLFVVPAIFIVKPNEDADSGSISAFFSAIPVRLIFPVIIVLILASNFIDRRKIAGCTAVGLACALAIINNFESGLVATVATTLVLFLTDIRQRPLARAGLVAGFTAAGLILSALLLWRTVGVPKLATLTDFVGGFGSGFGALPMPSFGLWIFAFVVLSLGTIVAAFRIRVSADEAPSVIRNPAERAACIGLFWGLFGIGTSPYYVNRSSVAGQLQFILISVFLTGACLFVLVAGLYRRAAPRSALLLIAALPPAISLASLLQFPSFSLAKARLERFGHPISEHYKPLTAQLGETVLELQATSPGARVGVFANYGSILSSPIQVRSYLPFNSDEADLAIIKRNLVPQLCASLAGNDFLIAYAVRLQTTYLLSECGYSLHSSKPDQQIYNRKTWVRSVELGGPERDAKPRVGSCGIDQIGRLPTRSITTVRKDRGLILLGWAASPDRLRTPDRVAVVLQGEGGETFYATAQTGLDRPDVATAFNSPALLPSGFESTMPMNIRLGRYRLLVRLDYDGQLDSCETGLAIVVSD